MKYQASLPEHNDNISHEHPLKDFVLILLGLSAAILAAYLLLGWLVDVVVDRMSPATEARLTQLMAWEAPKAEPAMVQREVWAQALVDDLRQCAGVSQPVTVRVSASDTPNAMVAPGGNVIVYSALFDKVASENGMAFVLAHELSHLVHRDHLRGIGRALVLVAATTVLTGDGSGAASVLAPASHLGESRYSRGRESAADAGALAILKCRYGHAGGATEFFDAMRNEDETPAFAHYLASHPSAGARVTALQEAIRRVGMPVGDTVPLPSFK